MGSTRRDGLVAGLFVMAMVVMSSLGGEATLTTDFYDESCPQIYSIVKQQIKIAVQAEPRMAASLVRLHFHDCFVNGCDGSVLLDNVTLPDGSFTGTEKFSKANANSIRGFDVIDAIKDGLEQACPQTVSCADIVAIASRDSAVEVGLVPEYPVYFGRSDGLTASDAAADEFLPGPNLNYSGLVKKFAAVGMNQVDLVALSGAHTIGRVKCAIIRGLSLTDPDINDEFREYLNTTVCPPGSEKPTDPQDPPNNRTFPLTDLDLTTPDKFDSNYYSNLRKDEGMIPSDQTLASTFGLNQALVLSYALSEPLWFAQFAISTIKMGNISPPEDAESEIRLNCHFPNSYIPSTSYLKTRVDTRDLQPPRFSHIASVVEKVA